MVKQRDSNLDKPCVKMYREVCRITPNYYQRREIVVTIERGGEVGLKRWQAVLEKFMLEGRNPARVDWCLDRYEALVRQRENPAL